MTSGHLDQTRHHPGNYAQVAAHDGAKVSEIKPHERDLDQPTPADFRKPWERRRRARLILAVILLIAGLALAGLIAFVDQAAKDGRLGHVPKAGPHDAPSTESVT